MGVHKMEVHRKDIHQVIARQVPDLVIYTNDGEQVLGHSVMLSLHSHLLAEIIGRVQEGDRIGITVEASAREVRDIMEMIEKNNEDLELVEDNDVIFQLGIRQNLSRNSEVTEEVYIA